jgi:hypothetical protein
VQPLTAHEHWHVDHGKHELTADGRKNLQRLEKPRNNRLTLAYPPVSLRRTGLGW